MSNWKRIKRQEGGKVYRWFEKGETIASVVEGYFPREANIRITGRGFDAIEVRGHKFAILKLSDSSLIHKFDRYIQAEKGRRKKKKPLKKRRKKTSKKKKQPRRKNPGFTRIGSTKWKKNLL